MRDDPFQGSQRGPAPELTLNPVVIPLHREAVALNKRLWLPLMLH